MEQFKVDSDSAGTRADVFVASKHPKFSRASLKGLFKRQKVFLDGKLARAGQKLRPGQTLDIDAAALHTSPPLVELPVLYEDADVVVINKPAGVLTHSKGVLNIEATVASFIKSRLSDKKMTGNRAGIVHRLDRGTSGIIIAAKNGAALAWLQKQFATRKVQKTYLAIVERSLRPPAALIDAPIARNPRRPQTFKVSSAGRPAQTAYRVEKTFKKAGQTYSLVELSPVTGRTHQLRVHMAYAGYPIVGDSVYGRGSGTPVMLHASQLTITLPGGQHKSFRAPLPETFKVFADN